MSFLTLTLSNISAVLEMTRSLSASEVSSIAAAAPFFKPPSAINFRARPPSVKTVNVVALPGDLNEVRRKASRIETPHRR